MCASLFSVVLVIGFVSSVYTAIESKEYVMVCVEVKDGSLSLSLNLSIQSAGMCTCSVC